MGLPAGQLKGAAMSLAVRCPQCSTVFRLPAEILARAGASVRCGVCQQVFDSVQARFELPSETPEAASQPPAFSTIDGDYSDWEDDLPYVPSSADEAVQTINLPRDLLELPDPATLAATSMSVEATVIDGAALADPSGGESAGEESSGDERRVAVAPSAGPVAARDAAIVDNTPTDSSPADNTSTDVTPLAPKEDAAIIGAAVTDAPINAPIDTSVDAAKDGDLLPSFIRASRPDARRIQRVLRWSTAAAAVLLVLQILIGGRQLLVTWVPSLRPLLSSICLPFGCQVEWPHKIAALSIESSTLDPLTAARARSLGLSAVVTTTPGFANTAATATGVVPGNNAANPQTHALMLSVVLRNRAQIMVAWPTLELSLTDAADQTLSRRVLLPASYLPLLKQAYPNQNMEGLAAGEERVLKVALRAPVANGFRLALFYP